MWQWYETAAMPGHAIGQYNLAKLYYTELDVPQDNVRAYMWVNLAAVHMTGDEQK
jgi:TPR repeat protein